MDGDAYFGGFCCCLSLSVSSFFSVCLYFLCILVDISSCMEADNMSNPVPHSFASSKCILYSCLFS